MTDPRKAYFILESQTDDKGNFRALVAVEGELGYYKTDWFWGNDLVKAEAITEEKNEAMGIDRKEACKIVLSTMQKGAIKRPGFGGDES